jgi:hypothetical protein
MNDVAAWFIDNDYDEESFFLREILRKGRGAWKILNASVG